MASSSDFQTELYLQLLPELAVRDIIERVNRSLSRARDNFVLRLLCPNVRRILSKPMTHLSTFELSRVGGGIQDLKFVPELSSFHLDFKNFSVDDSDLALLKDFRELRDLTLSNIDVRCSPRQRNESLYVADEMSHRSIEQDQFSCAIPLFSCVPFLQDRKTRGPMQAFQFLTGMTSLRHLTIDGSTTRCTVILSFILEVPQLETLSIHLLNFKGCEARQLRHLRAKLDLTLHGHVSKRGFRELRRFPTLTDLTLLHCGVGTFSFPIKKLQALKHLSIQCSTLNDRDILYLSEIGDRLSALEISLLDTDPNTLSGICDMTVPITALSVRMEVVQCSRSLENFTKLEFLRLEATNEHFNSDEFLSLGHCSRLKHLHVIGCSDWSLILSSEVLGSSLTSLTIGWSLLKGEDLRGLRRLESLQDLTLSLCHLLDTLSPLRDMTQLRSLTINQCSRLEESMEEILLSSLPEGLDELKLGVSDGLGFEVHEDLLVRLDEWFPRLKVLLANANL